MSIHVQCECGQQLRAREEFAGKRAECSYCGRSLRIPEVSSDAPPESATAAQTGPKGETATAQREEAAEITEFLDPPSRPVGSERKPVSLRPMFEALLDPRSIQWMLILGGGLAVLGLVIWLASAGVFENKVILAATLITGSLATLAAGWFVVLKTRYRIAGQALTFLACVVAPLNLWFLHAQGLVTIEGHLWLGGIVCCLLYAATVYILRDPLFMYAVQAGVMLTVGLILTELRLIRDTPSLSIFLMALGLISIHAERAFSPEEGPFPRKRFGMPLFWSGHVQLALSLLILLWAQLTGWMAGPLQQWFGIQWPGNLLTDWSILAGGLWLAGTYAYLYSDIVVRRVGVYTFLAAFCFLLAEVTLVGRWRGEGVIAILSLTAMAAIAVQSYVARANERLSQAVLPLALGLSVLPILIGIGLHIRATSELAERFGWDCETGGWFLAVMLLAAVCNRAAAFLYRRTAPKWSAAYFFLSAAALIVAAAGLLRWRGVEEWANQAPWLMMIPLAYMVASRLWRGHSPAAPLYWVAQASTAVILLHVLAATVTSLETLTLALQPVRRQPENLLLGLVFVEAAVFYALGMFFRRRSVNVYLAAAAACAALWQLLHYFGFPGPYYTMIYAALGVGLIGVSRSLGIEKVSIYRNTGAEGLAIRGRGLAVFQTGNAIVSFSLLAALFQGLTRLVHLRSLPGIEWEPVFALALAIAASLTAACLVPSGGWRRTYATATVGLGAILFLTLNLQIDLTGWQKLEIFCVIVGVLLITASYVGRFRETGSEENETVSVGLFMGSLLAALPLLTAVIYHRYTGRAIGDFSLYDEMALLAVTVLMLLTGLSWQIKSTTFFGGVSLVLYLLIFVVSLSSGFLDRQWIIGIAMAIGGSVIFAAGIGLSVYREKLLQLPERIANREGVFRVLNWR